jgi:hypothetical protein
MIVFCPGCGTKISAPSSPIDPDGSVTCPKCKSQFATAGVKANAAVSEPKRKFKPKKPSGSGAGILIALVVVALIGGGAFAAYYFGLFGQSANNAGPIAKTPEHWEGWRLFSSVDGRFTVSLPGAPTRKVRSSREVEYGLETPDAKIGVVYADLSEKDKPEKHMVAPPGSKMLGEKEITHGNLTGREIVAEVPGHGIAHLRFFTSGNRLYTVMIVGKNRPPAESEIARVFDSFQITG